MLQKEFTFLRKELQSVLNCKDFAHVLFFLAAITPLKMKRFVIIVNGWKPLTIITKRSILDVAAVLDPPLLMRRKQV